MNWEYIDTQQKGFPYDYIAPDGSKIEAKFDWDSIKTGNHYLEIAQTSDNKKTDTFGLFDFVMKQISGSNQ